MSVADIWEAEELLWTGGTDAFRNRMAEGCLMVFPGMGVLKWDAVLDALSAAPRWSQVAMTERHEEASDGVTVLAYRARGLRDGDEPYDAYCSSTWVQVGGQWRIAQHHQTPLG